MPDSCGPSVIGSKTMGFEIYSTLAILSLNSVDGSIYIIIPASSCFTCISEVTRVQILALNIDDCRAYISNYLQLPAVIIQV